MAGADDVEGKGFWGFVRVNDGPETEVSFRITATVDDFRVGLDVNDLRVGD